jgi:putative peptide zinc metalloprotease protein
MATLADSLVSSSARPLPLRVRPDLSAKSHRYQGRPYWIIKDPVGLHYFRFQEEEYAILNMLDGKTSLDNLKERFEAQFPPQKITVEELGQFVGTLHKSNLVVTDVPGQGLQLFNRRWERRKKEIWGAAANLLSLRFKGIDPDRILEWLHPKFRWMYSPTGVTACLLLYASALMLILVQFNIFRAKLPSFHEFFTAQNWIWLGISLAVTKVIHEFGHGLTCKHFGGECHEMGVMLLVFTPCLYCNVSDSWMLPNKWHRAYIGAAGMYIELCIASVCTWIWWYSNPGLLNNVCLSTMFVCSVSTVMFNANPLLRYDGYYIMSDITEIPNLRQKATTLFSRKAGKYFLGLEEPEDPFLPQRNQGFFVLYSVAAAMYRWVVTFSIMWFLYKVFEPYGLKILSQILASVSIFGLVGAPIWQVGKFFWVPGRLHQVKRRNLQITLAMLAAIVLFIFYVPLPYRVICTLEVKPRGAESIYVSMPGRLEESLEEGKQVHKGDPIAVLSSPDLQAQIEETKGKIASAIIQKNMFSDLASDGDNGARDQIDTAQQSIATYRKQLAEKLTKNEQLTLRAPKDGIVLPAPRQPKKETPANELPAWHGSPLDQINLGTYLPEGTLVCQIGDPTRMEAVLVAEQDDRENITVGVPVSIMLDCLPGVLFTGRISEIADKPLDVVPQHMTNKAGGEVITKSDPSGAQHPQNISYQVKVPLEDHELLTIGVRGRAKIHARWQTIWERSWRLFMRTFNFKM